MAGIDDLPDELLLSILDYLSYKQRKDARFINKRWYRLCNSARYVKNEVLVVTDPSRLGEIGTNRKYFSIRVEYASNSLTQTDFWSQCGDYVKSIEMYRLEKLTPDLLDIFVKCPNLEHITLRDMWGDEKITHPPLLLRNLLSFTVLYSHGINSSVFKTFLQNAFKLERLSVNIYDFGSEDQDSWELIEIVTRQSAIMQKLKFSFNFMPTETVLRILNKLGTQFSEFSVNRRERVCERNLESSGRYVPLIKERNEKQINVSCCEFPRNCVRDMIILLKNLTSVSLSDMFIDEFLFAQLFLIENLDTLRISRPIEGIKLVEAFGGIPRPNLIDLQLNHINTVTGDVLANICPLLPNIRHLNLCHCPNVGGQGLEAISKNNKKLRSLFLSHCDKIYNFSDINKLVHLVHLDLDFENSRPIQLLRDLILPNLQTLNLGRARLCHVDVGPLLLGCTSLQHVYYESKEKHVCKDIDKFTPPDGMPTFHVFLTTDDTDDEMYETDEEVYETDEEVYETDEEVYDTEEDEYETDDEVYDAFVRRANSYDRMGGIGDNMDNSDVDMDDSDVDMDDTDDDIDNIREYA